MALKTLLCGREPIGIFDGYDADYLTIKGGEVVTLISVPTPAQPGITSAGFDQAAFDVFDGYTLPSSVQKRPAVTHTLTSGKRPLYLADDGISGYGTLFGQVVGGVAGQVTAGTQLGPSTQTGSGKITCWDKPGLYGVTLDACDTNATTGLQPTNTTLDTGAALYATSAGLLTPNSAVAFETVVLARFIEFATNGSLVTTPAFLTQAFNSPSGTLPSKRSFSVAVFQWSPPVA